jgi:hypothetical protein
LESLENPQKKYVQLPYGFPYHNITTAIGKPQKKKYEKIGTSAWRWRSEARLRRKRRAALEVGRRSEVSVSWLKKLKGPEKV